MSMRNYHRAGAFQRAIGAFWVGLAKIPAFSHNCLLFPWQCLVTPLAAYGAEVYVWEERDVSPFVKAQSQAWWRALGVGGRAPVDSIFPFMPMDAVTITWRAQRLSLLLRLINSQAGSLQQIVLSELQRLSAPWYLAALEDLKIVIPEVELSVGIGPSELFE